MASRLPYHPWNRLSHRQFLERFQEPRYARPGLDLLLWPLLMSHMAHQAL